VLCDNTTSPLILANNSSALRAQHCVTVVILARFYELILWMTAIDAAMLSERSDSSFFAALRMVPSVINGQSHPPHSSGPTESYLVTTEVPPLQPLNTVAPPPLPPPMWPPREQLLFIMHKEHTTSYQFKKMSTITGAVTMQIHAARMTARI